MIKILQRMLNYLKKLKHRECIDIFLICLIIILEICTGSLMVSICIYASVNGTRNDIIISWLMLLLYIMGNVAILFCCSPFKTGQQNIEKFNRESEVFIR